MDRLAALIAGFCFFLYGMQLASDGLRQLFGERLRKQIHRLTSNVLRGLILGTVATLLLQSSSVTTVMIVGLANLGMISVMAGLGVALGSCIGTSLFVLVLSRIISFDLESVALFVFSIGFFIVFISKRRAVGLGRMAMGYGLLLFGMKMMAQIGEPLRANPELLEHILNFSGNPIYGVMTAAIITAILQSSAATIAIILSLALAGAMRLDAAIPLILGANIGTTVSALMASIDASTDGKRIAMGHLLVKVVGVVILLPFVSHLTLFIEQTSDNLTFQIANMHVFFNVFIALGLAPFLKPLTKLVDKMVPAPASPEGFHAKFLDQKALDTPALAFGNVLREMLRMAEVVQDMLKRCLQPIEKGDTKIIEELESMDDKVDLLAREIRFYLAKLSQGELTDAQAKEELNLISATEGFEEIGDIINRSIMELSAKKIKLDVTFSEDGWQEIRKFHALVLENYSLAINAFTTGNEELFRKVMRHKVKLREIEEEMKQAHIMRLHKGLKESFATSSLHLDLLGNLLRINALICRIAAQMFPFHD